MTQWSPDTCGCVVEYDDNISVVAVIKKCPKHATTPNDVNHLATVLAHNRKKNHVHNATVDMIKSTGGDPSEVFTVYDAQDNLVVNNSRLTVADQNKVTVGLKPQLGTSSVKFQG